MKNIELLKMYESIDSAVSQCSIVLPVATAFKIVKNKHILKSAAQSYIDLRDALITKYADGGDHITAEMSGFVPFQKEYRELNNLETEVNFEKIALSEIESAALPLNVLDCIYPMIGG